MDSQRLKGLEKQPVLLKEKAKNGILKKKCTEKIKWKRAGKGKMKF